MNIKIAVIPPVENLQLAEQGDIGMVLAHLAWRDLNYKIFYEKLDKWKILDNGLAENMQVTPEILVNLVDELKINEVILPDRLYDSERTITQAFEFVRRFRKKLPQTSFQVVPQGENTEDWIYCYEQLLRLPIQTIGLSKLSVPKCFSLKTDQEAISASRVRCVNHLVKERLIDKEKEYHLLGMGNPKELMYYKKFPFIRSCDSAFPIVAAVNKIKFDDNNGLLDARVKTSEEYFNHKMSKDEINLAQHNIQVTKNFATR